MRLGPKLARSVSHGCSSIDVMEAMGNKVEMTFGPTWSQEVAIFSVCVLPRSTVLGRHYSITAMMGNRFDVMTLPCGYRAV